LKKKVIIASLDSLVLNIKREQHSMQLLTVNSFASALFENENSLVICAVALGLLAFFSWRYLFPSSKLPQKPTSTAVIRNTRVPPHVNATAATNASAVLVDGLVAFRHSHAFVAANDDSTVAENNNNSATIRKERAQVLSRMIVNTANLKLPAKGSVLIVSLSERDCSDPASQRVLYLIGTYYNLLVMIVVVATATSENNTVLSRCTMALRTTVPATVLPNHRILASTTVAGRVALARQVERVELVVDPSTEVKSQLERFQHSVVCYQTSLGEYLTVQ
jgi:hypothetical protein